MKKIIFFTLLLCTRLVVFAQSNEYESCFGVESTKWIIATPTSYWGIEHGDEPGYYFLDSVQCYGWYYKEQNKGVVFFETDGNSKLWRRDVQTNDKNLVMNLDWKVGDTIYINQDALKQLPDEIPFAIVDSVFFDSENRKTIQTDLVLRIDTTHFKLKYIEGVGPNASFYLLEDNGFFWDMSNLLLCAYKDDVLTYVNTEAGGQCSYQKPDLSPLVKAAEDVLITLQSNTIDLKFSNTFSCKLCVINTDGKVVKKVNINRNNKIVDISDLADGVYIVQLTNRSDNYCQTKKITKTSSK